MPGAQLADPVRGEHGPSGRGGERLGDRRLAARGQPGHADEPRAGARARRSARRARAARGRARGRSSAARAGQLRGAQEVDLRAHERAHRAQEREQLVAARVAAGGAVAAHERARELVVAAGDVHDQEREVVGDVGDAQVAVELERRRRPRSARRAGCARRAGRRGRRARGRRRRGAASSGPNAASAARQKRASAVEPRGGRAGGGERGQRLLDHGREPDRAAVRTGASAWKPATARADGDQVGRRARRGRAARRASRLVVAAHHDRVLDGARVGLERDLQARRVRAARARRRPRYTLGAKRRLSRSSSAQQRAPALERAVVEEREPDRLLDLVRRVAGEEHPRDVRLAQLDAAGMREGGGFEQRAGRRRVAAGEVVLMAQRSSRARGRDAIRQHPPSAAGNPQRDAATTRRGAGATLRRSGHDRQRPLRASSASTAPPPAARPSRSGPRWPC